MEPYVYDDREPHGPKRGVQATGQEATVPRPAPRSPPKTVVTEATTEATTEESSSGSNSSEGMETNDEGATSATGESATWSEKKSW